VTRSTSTNFTGANSFTMADAPDDDFELEDIQQLAAAVDAHDHTTGKGAAVTAGSAPAASVTRTASTAMSADQTHYVTWTAEVYDTNNIWDSGSPTRFTCQTAGKYLLVGNQQGTHSSFQARWRINGTATEFAKVGPTNNNTASMVLSMAVGDYAEFVVYLGLSSGSYTASAQITRIG
jgi:hypothetical protein